MCSYKKSNEQIITRRHPITSHDYRMYSGNSPIFIASILTGLVFAWFCFCFVVMGPPARLRRYIICAEFLQYSNIYVQHVFLRYSLRSLRSLLVLRLSFCLVTSYLVFAAFYLIDERFCWLTYHIIDLAIGGEESLIFTKFSYYLKNHIAISINEVPTSSLCGGHF